LRTTSAATRGNDQGTGLRRFPKVAACDPSSLSPEFDPAPAGRFPLRHLAFGRGQGGEFLEGEATFASQVAKAGGIVRVEFNENRGKTKSHFWGSRKIAIQAIFLYANRKRGFPLPWLKKSRDGLFQHLVREISPPSHHLDGHVLQRIGRYVDALGDLLQLHQHVPLVEQLLAIEPGIEIGGGTRTIGDHFVV